MSVEAMRQALEALENHMEQTRPINMTQNAIHALRQAVEQAEKQEPEQKPVAKVVLPDTIGLPLLRWLDLGRRFDFKGGELLYVAPPHKEWVGLTDEQIVKSVREIGWGQSYINWTEIIEFTRYIEAKLKEKNT